MTGVLQQVKAHAAEFDQAYMVVGDFYLRIGDGDTAVREYKEGMAKDPKKKIEYEKRIVEVYMRQGRRARSGGLERADPEGRSERQRREGSGRDVHAG